MMGPSGGLHYLHAQKKVRFIKFFFFFFILSFERTWHMLTYHWLSRRIYICSYTAYKECTHKYRQVSCIRAVVKVIGWYNIDGKLHKIRVHTKWKKKKNTKKPLTVIFFNFEVNTIFLMIWRLAFWITYLTYYILHITTINLIYTLPLYSNFIISYSFCIYFIKLRVLLSIH